MRILSTPIAAPVEWPAARPPGVSPDLLPAFLFPPGTDALRAKLINPETLVVTTGQQPGLFTGPLYTIYKALSAAALAKQLEERWDRPVQAVFWIAGDDHDFAEANHLGWPAADGVSGVTLRHRESDAALTPMYREPLGPEVVAALERFEQELPGGEFKAEVVDWLGRYYQPAVTVAESFAGALAELLAPHGVLCFISTHHAAKRAGARHIIKALGLARDLDQDLGRRSRELIAAGADPGVPVGDAATLVMLESAAGRDRLVIDGDGFISRRGGVRFSLAELQAIAAEFPERLSANVLLRPVIESALLPTVAYMAGPGELRYLALTTPIYDRMRIHRQLPLPRWSGVMVEPRVDRTLTKYGADVDELLAPGGALEARVVRAQLPKDALEAFSDLRARIIAGYERIEPVAVGVDPTLKKPVESARQHALSESQDLEKRLIQHLKRRQETELKQIERAREAILPSGKPQERVFGIASYLARYGSGILDEVRAAIEPWYRTALEAQPQSS
ncbi:MAG: bacillithiol biosynthesis cysteine-adding enzyme BshC [Gemmatimonadota bacterium]